MHKNLNVLISFAIMVATPKVMAKEKPAKVKWKEVEIVDEEPKDCKFIEKLDVDSGTWMTFSGKGFKEKAQKKMKKAAGKAGANKVFITKEIMVGNVMNREANAYFCAEEKTSL